MKARMEELSIFYDENIDEEKIQFFEKLRLKLKKALFNRPNKNHVESTANLDDDDGDFNFERAPLSQEEVAAWENQSPY